MRIVRLESENVKRIRAISVTPDGALVRVEGRNGQGKSSLLDSIQYALGGAEVQPPKVIREGESSAKVVLELDDLVVERRWTAKGTRLEVRSKAGAVHKSPQTILDKLVGSLSFDPLAYVRLPAKAQADQLRALVGVDVSALDASRKLLFDERTLVNRDLGQAEARLKAAPAELAPDAPVDVGELLAEQERLQAEKARNDGIRREVQRALELAALAAGQVTFAEREVKRLEGLLSAARKALDSATSASATAKAAADEADMQAASLTDPDLTSVRERIANASRTNEAVARKKARAQLEAAVAKLAKESGEKTEAISGIDAEKAKRLGAAKFPVPELGFTGEGVTLKGLPLSQASSAEQLRVAMAMGLAANPTLKVVLIREGSLLDEESLALVAKMADEAGAQVWLESVASKASEGCSVFIEDGQVAAGPEAEHTKKRAS